MVRALHTFTALALTSLYVAIVIVSHGLHDHGRCHHDGDQVCASARLGSHAPGDYPLAAGLEVAKLEATKSASRHVDVQPHGPNKSAAISAEHDCLGCQMLWLLAQGYAPADSATTAGDGIQPTPESSELQIARQPSLFYAPRGPPRHDSYVG